MGKSRTAAPLSATPNGLKKVEKYGLTNKYRRTGLLGIMPIPSTKTMFGAAGKGDLKKGMAIAMGIRPGHSTKEEHSQAKELKLANMHLAKYITSVGDLSTFKGSKFNKGSVAMNYYAKKGATINPTTSKPRARLHGAKTKSYG